MTKLFLIAATLLTVAVSPAVAREVRVPASDTSRSADSSVQASAPAARPNQKYCIIETPTGSHIRHRICQTRDQWLDDGFDPLAKN